MNDSYKSLEQHLPNLSRDKFGNLTLIREGSGLRRRVEYALKINSALLNGTILAELLDWMRWGGEAHSMWECTLPELIQIIEKWLGANLDASQEQFGFEHLVDWDQMWNLKGGKTGIRRARQCQCGRIHTEFCHDCRKCFQRWYDMDAIIVGTRGPNTYNLTLHSAGGSDIAAAVWNKRQWLITEPEEFLNNEKYFQYAFV